MKKIFVLIALLFCAINQLISQHSAPNFITINEIKTYGTNNQYDEYVELFNISDSSFNIGKYNLIYYLNNGQPYKVLYAFPESTFIAPYHYYLLASPEYTEAKLPDAVMEHGLLSNGQLLLMDSTKTDTLDAVAWGLIDSIITNEGAPAEYIEPVEGPPASPDLLACPQWSLQRDPEGNDTNNNYEDFKMRMFTTPMNSSDSLKLILQNTICANRINQNTISIKWKTISRTKDLLYLICKKAQSANDWLELNPGSALTIETKNDTKYYQYIQSDVDFNIVYQYKIKEIDFTQCPRYSNIILIDPQKLESETQHPIYFILQQNFPNPFNPSTAIKYSIFKEGYVTIKIYNIYGQEVKTLFNDQQISGNFTIDWDATDSFNKKVPSGAYFCVLLYGNEFRSVKKMIILK